MSKTRLLMTVVTIFILTVTGVIYTQKHNQAQTIKQIQEYDINNTARSNTNQSYSSAMATVWDQETETYTGNMEMTVYLSPNCSCCGSWMAHAQKHGFHITEIKTDDMDSIKREYHIPPELASCHTAMIDGYVMEGHIPAGDIKEFLSQKPDVKGLTVPGMPLGTPGMETRNIKQPFDILTLNDDGEVEVFKHYENY
jgi:hypothetical protein